MCMCCPSHPTSPSPPASSPAHLSSCLPPVPTLPAAHVAARLRSRRPQVCDCTGRRGGASGASRGSRAASKRRQWPAAAKRQAVMLGEELFPFSGALPAPVAPCFAAPFLACMPRCSATLFRRIATSATPLVFHRRTWMASCCAGRTKLLRQRCTPACCECFPAGWSSEP